MSTTSSAKIRPYFPPPPTFAMSSKAQPKPAENTTARRPQTLRRSRRFLLPLLLLLCFTTTILSTIYAYCVTSRHTRLSEADYASNPNAELNDSIFRRGTLANDNDNDNDTTNSSSPPLTLILWALTTPLTTILLILLELTAHITRPHLNVSRLAHYLFLVLALLLAASWLSTTVFWTHCEIHTSTKHLSMCPASLRNHFMFGIHQVSIAKATLAGLVALGFLVHASCIVRNLHGLKTFGAAMAGRGLGIKHGEAQMVLEREMEAGLRVQRDLRKELARNGNGRKDLKVRIVG